MAVKYSITEPQESIWCLTASLLLVEGETRLTVSPRNFMDVALYMPKHDDNKVSDQPISENKGHSYTDLTTTCRQRQNVRQFFAETTDRCITDRERLGIRFTSMDQVSWHLNCSGTTETGHTEYRQLTAFVM